MDSEEFLNRVLQNSFDFSAWESHARTEGAVEDGFRWDVRNVSYEGRQRIDDMYKKALGIEDAALGNGGVLRTMKPVENPWTHGYGIMAFDPASYRARGGNVEDLSKMLRYATGNVQQRGKTMPGYSFTNRYTSSFLKSQAQHLSDAISGNLIGKAALVLDVETAGLDFGSGIWQLSAKMVGGDRDGRTLDMTIRNKNLALGMMPSPSGPTSPINMRELINLSRQGELHDDIIGGIQDLARMVSQADVIVAQNAVFDVSHILRDIADADKAGLSDEVLRSIETLQDALKSANVIDTKIMSVALFGSTIDVADDLKKINQYTPFSVENILLKTNFLDVLAKDLGGWDEILEHLNTSGEGLHTAKTDVWFESHLYRLMTQELQDGREMLRAGFSGYGFGSTRKARRALREAGGSVEGVVRTITATQAKTPYTVVDGARTGIEVMLDHFRELSKPLKARSGDIFYKAGLIANWADSVLEGGHLPNAERLMNSNFADVAAQAQKHGLSIAGLSPVDTLLTTQISRNSYGGGALRKQVGEVMGGSFKKHSGIRTFGQGVAISPEILEEAGVGKFGKALGDTVDDLQMGYLSTVTREGKGKGVALKVDLSEDEMQRLTRWLGELGEEELERLGLSKRAVGEALNKLTPDSARFGVQIGFLDDPGDLVNLMESLGLDKDTSEEALRVAVGVFSTDNAKEIGTGPALLQGRHGLSDEAKAGLLHRTRRAKEITMEATQNLSRDHAKRAAITLAKHRGADKVSKMYDVITNRKTKGGLIAGALGVVGYYMYNRKERQDPYDEAMSSSYDNQGVLTDINGALSVDFGPPMSSRPLETAGLVQNLNARRSGHYQMGPNKYDHLF